MPNVLPRIISPILRCSLSCALSVWTCSAAFSQDQVPLSEVVEDVRGGTAFQFRIHPSSLIYAFHLIGDPASNTIVRIEVSRQNDPAIIQTLEAGMGEQPYRGADYFQVEDINFDGYLDIKLLAWWGATGNKGYRYWLFDKETDHFVYDEAFSELCNPIPHPETKTITTSSVGGMAGRIHTFAAFQVMDGKPTVIWEEHQGWIEDGKYFLKVITERNNGELEVVSKEIVRDAFWE